jgi:hypothetical protein
MADQTNHVEEQKLQTMKVSLRRQSSAGRLRYFIQSDELNKSGSNLKV